MQEIKAAPHLADLMKVPSARCHPLGGNLAGEYAVDLKHPKRLVFTPDEGSRPKGGEGIFDPNQITSITILEVTDYHD